MKQSYQPGASVTWKNPHADKRFTAKEYGLIGYVKENGYGGKVHYFIWWFSAKGKVKYASSDFTRDLLRRCKRPLSEGAWLVLTDVFEDMPLCFIEETQAVPLSMKDRRDEVYIATMKVSKKYVSHFTDALIQ